MERCEEIGLSTNRRSFPFENRDVYLLVIAVRGDQYAHSWTSCASKNPYRIELNPEVKSVGAMETIRPAYWSTAKEDSLSCAGAGVHQILLVFPLVQPFESAMASPTNIAFSF